MTSIRVRINLHLCLLNSSVSTNFSSQSAPIIQRVVGSMKLGIAREFTKDINTRCHVFKLIMVYVSFIEQIESILFSSLRFFSTSSVFTGCGDALVRCFDARSGVLKRSFKSHSLAVNCIQVLNLFLWFFSKKKNFRRRKAKIPTSKFFD